jgi:cytochrome c-type protein NapC
MVVNCATCHIPEEFIPRLTVKVMALRDVWSYFQGTLDTPEKFEAKRLEMAKTVWARMAARQDRECRKCHVTETMMNPNKPVNRKLHLAADKDGQPCSDCHEGVAHKAPIHPEEEESAE